MGASQPVLVVVSNSTEAEIYTHAQRYSTPALVVSVKADALVKDAPKDFSDRPGRTFDSAGAGRHAMSPTSEPQRLAEEQFARALNRELARIFEAHRCGQLVVIAPPRFLGALRATMPDVLDKTVTCTVTKDLVGEEPGRLKSLLAELDGVTRL